jgi:hypothetical protein
MLKNIYNHSRKKNVSSFVVLVARRAITPNFPSFTLRKDICILFLEDSMQGGAIPLPHPASHQAEIKGTQNTPPVQETISFPGTQQARERKRRRQYLINCASQSGMDA